MIVTRLGTVLNRENQRIQKKRMTANAIIINAVNVQYLEAGQSRRR
jgi:hypothetical protein